MLFFSLAAAWFASRTRRGRGLAARLNAAETGLPRAAFVLALVYFLAYSCLSVHRCHKLMCGMWDLGIFESLLANALGGRFFQDYRGAFDHLDVNLAFFLPFYALWRDARVLLVLQAFVIALAAWPLYLLARGVCGRKSAAAVVVVIYLLYPLLGAGNLYDFHVISLSPLLFFSMLLFMHRRRWGWYWVFATLVLLTKETEAILVLGAGLYLVFRREYLRGAITAALAVAWVLAATFLILPAITGEPFRHFGRYTGGLQWGRVAGAGFRYAFLYGARLTAVLLFTLVPAGFLFARRWRPFVFIFGPVLAANMLSRDLFQQALFGHYGLTVTAAALGAAALATENMRGFSPGERPSMLPLFALASALLSNLLFSYPAYHRFVSPAAHFESAKSWNVLSLPLPVSQARREFYGLSDDDDFFRSAARLFPPGATVAAQNNLGYLLAGTCRLRDLSADVAADFYLFHPGKNDGFTALNEYNGLFRRLADSRASVRFLDLSRPGEPGFVFFSNGERWLDFYQNARAAADREPQNGHYALAAARVEAIMGLPGPGKPVGRDSPDPQRGP